MSAEREGRGAPGAEVSSPPAAHGSPGARTLTQRLPRTAPGPATAPEAGPAPPRASYDPVEDDPFGFQLHGTVQFAASTSVDVAAVHAHARRGVAGPGQALPHHAAIQAAFGHHDLTGVQAHVGGAAADASTAMGAQAYATGNDVAFAAAPDLHTAAHEAAHVVQQRAGVQLYGGVGEVGDDYERHADQVADGVVAGRSVEALLDTKASGEARAATPSVQRSPAPGAAAGAGGTDIVGALIGPQGRSDAYARRHWPQLRDAAHAALLAADLTWDAPLQWANGSRPERAEAALAFVWPEVFVPAAWDATFTRDIHEAIELGLSIGRARQAQVAPDDERSAMERYHATVGKTVGNTIVQRLQRSMRLVGPEYVDAHAAAGGGEVDTSRLPVTGVSDRAAIALLAFTRVSTGGERLTATAHPAGRRRRHPRPTREPRPAPSAPDADANDEALVEQVQQRLLLLAGLVGEANLDALSPAYAFLTDDPTRSPDGWRQTLARQAQQLEVIRGEVLTLLTLSHRAVPLTLKADAVAAYARAAGAAHLPDAERLLRLARDEVAALDARSSVTAARAEAEAIEARAPANVGVADLDALAARADRATRGGRRPDAEPSDPARTVGAGADTAPSDAVSPGLAADARASRVSAFRHGALRLADTLAEARVALMNSRELVSTPFTAHIAQDCEALAGEIGGVEDLLHQLVEDVATRAGRSAVPLVEDAIVAEAEERFRDFIKTSGVSDLGKRVHAMLARVERAHAILATLGFALVMIGVSVAGGLAGAYVGGAVRGALTPTAVAAAGETTTAATVGGLVAGVATESVIVGGFQAAVSDQSLGAAAGENMLAAGFTFGALTAVRWASVLTRVKSTWANGSLARVLGPGATDLAVGMGANVVARSLMHPDAPVGDDQLLDWTTAAASMVVGRWLGSRLSSLHQRLDAAGTRLGRDARGLRELDQLRGELGALEREVPARAWTPDEYSALIDSRIVPLVDRIAALEQPGRSAQPPAPAARADATTPHAPTDTALTQVPVAPPHTGTSTPRGAVSRPAGHLDPVAPRAQPDGSSEHRDATLGDESAASSRSADGEGSPVGADVSRFGHSNHEQDRVLALDPVEGRRLIDEYGEELVEYVRVNPLTTIRELETALRRQRGQVKARVAGFYEGVDTAAPPANWTFDDTQYVEPFSNIKVIKTKVRGPNGAEGYFERAYDPRNNELELRMAFLRVGGKDVALPSVIPKQGAATEMIEGRGSPTVQYVTIYQMKRLGVMPGSTGSSGVKKIHMSDIQNVETIVHLHYLRDRIGGEPGDLVVHTPSVKYAETTALQSGYTPSRSPLVIGGQETPIHELLDFQEHGNPRRRQENDQLLAKYGYDRSTVMLWGFDIDFLVSPAP